MQAVRLEGRDSCGAAGNLGTAGVMQGRDGAP